MWPTLRKQASHTRRAGVPRVHSPPPGYRGRHAVHARVLQAPPGGRRRYLRRYGCPQHANTSFGASFFSFHSNPVPPASRGSPGPLGCVGTNARSRATPGRRTAAPRCHPPAGRGWARPPTFTVHFRVEGGRQGALLRKCVESRAASPCLAAQCTSPRVMPLRGRVRRRFGDVVATWWRRGVFTDCPTLYSISHTLFTQLSHTSLTLSLADSRSHITPHHQSCKRRCRCPAGRRSTRAWQGLTLVHYSAQLEPFLTQKHTLNTPYTP